jgi:transposase
MMLIGVDYHPSFQQIAFLMEETGECGEQQLNHDDGGAERFYRDLQQQGIRVRIGMEATGYSRWFERLLAELGFELWIGDPAEIKAKQLLWHRHRLVQMRTRIMNQLQALAMNEGYRWKKKLFSEQGRAQLEKLLLAPWASRRRQELLELLDRLNPTIEELTVAAEREARKRPDVLRLMTHPGVGSLTALAYVLIIGTPERFHCGKQIGKTLLRTRDVGQSVPQAPAPVAQVQPPVGVTRFRVTFMTPGTYPYICAFHDELGMKGEVIVLP